MYICIYIYICMHIYTFRYMYLYIHIYVFNIYKTLYICIYMKPNKHSFRLKKK